MAEYIERKAVVEMLENAQIISDGYYGYCGYCTEDVNIDAIPAADVVSRATFEQVMWERDVAIQQLKDLGVGFGEKNRKENSKMTIKDLVGYQLISMTEEKIVVQKNGITYTLMIVEDEGDCCGYNEITAQLYFDENNLTHNPVITNVKVTSKEVGDANEVEITFFGEVKVIAELTSMSSSGSGWQYGACVSIVCKDIDLNETISEW